MRESDLFRSQLQYRWDYGVNPIKVVSKYDDEHIKHTLAWIDRQIADLELEGATDLTLSVLNLTMWYTVFERTMMMRDK